MSSKAIKAFEILLGLTAVFSSGVNGQTVELTSVHLSVLQGAERDRFLSAHNVARRDVAVDPVTWSDDLSQYALESLTQQKDVLISAAKEGWTKGRAVLPSHRAESKFGENVAGWVGIKVKTAELAVEQWLREKVAFDKLSVVATHRVGDEENKTELKEKGQEHPVVGHYTAIVWRTTKQIGAARLAFDLVDDLGNVRSYVAIICNYSPPGNRQGEKPY